MRSFPRNRSTAGRREHRSLGGHRSAPAAAGDRGARRWPPYPSVRNTAIRMAVWMLATARSPPTMRHPGFQRAKLGPEDRRECGVWSPVCARNDYVRVASCFSRLEISSLGRKTASSPCQVFRAWVSRERATPIPSSSSTIHSTPCTRRPLAAATLRSRASPVSRMPGYASAVTRQKQSLAERAGWRFLSARA